MNYKTTGSLLMAAFLVMSVIGGIGAVSANHTNTDVYVGNASEMGINDTHTIYENPQNAFKNLTDNTTVAFQNGTYELNSSLDTNATNVTITAFSGNVTLNGANTTSGDVFNGSVDSWKIGNNVTITNQVGWFAGVSSGENSIVNKFTDPSESIGGVPTIVIWFVLLALGYVGYSKKDEME